MDHANNGIELTTLTNEATRLVGGSPLSVSKSIHAQFVWFSLTFSINHRAGLACLSLASAQLGKIGELQTGLLYLCYTLTALSGAPYLVHHYGSKAALLVGVWFFCAYVLSFCLAALIHDSIALLGAVLGGFGAGVAWTAQGVYYTEAVQLYCAKSDSLDTSFEMVSSIFAGTFAVTILLCETLLNAASWVLVELLSVPWSFVFALYGVLSIFAAGGMHSIPAHASIGDAVACHTKPSTVLSQICAALRVLITDSKMKYMAGFHGVYGLAGAFLNAYVSGTVIPIVLGNDGYVGLLVAVHGIVAALCSHGFGKMHSKVPVMVLGCIAFICVGAPVLILPDLSQWSVALVIFVYVVEGVGRAVSEGTLKALFADYFFDKKEGAFANIILQYGVSSTLAYFLSTQLQCNGDGDECNSSLMHRHVQYYVCLLVSCGLLAIAGILRASHLHMIAKERQAAFEVMSTG